MTLKSPHSFRSAFVIGLLLIPNWAHAGTWHLWAAAQTADKAALAFLPNEIWVHAGDTVTWTMAADDAHTVTSLRPGQVRPPFQVGCPGLTPDGSVETLATCVNSGVLPHGGSYSVAFPAAGNFKLVCPVHTMMTATVHVLDLSEPLPHDQAFYDEQAHREARALLSSVARAAHADHEGHDVAAGAGNVVATGGGFQTASVIASISRGPSFMWAIPWSGRARKRRRITPSPLDSNRPTPFRRRLTYSLTRTGPATQSSADRPIGATLGSFRLLHRIESVCLNPDSGRRAFASRLRRRVCTTTSAHCMTTSACADRWS